MLLNKSGRHEMDTPSDVARETLEMHFEGLQIILVEVLQYHDLIGRHFEKEQVLSFRSFQIKLKEGLEYLKNRLHTLQEMLIHLQETPETLFAKTKKLLQSNKPKSLSLGLHGMDDMDDNTPNAKIHFFCYL